MTLLPAAPQVVAFCAAAIALAVTPGPGVLYVVARTVSQGPRSGLASVAGVALGNLGNAWAAALGLAALMAAWPPAFDAVRVAGAIWLMWLAWQALRGASSAGDATPIAVASPSRVFADGFMVALLNPKTALFFAAFLPQFMSPAIAPVPQALALSTIFVAIAAVTDSAWVALASRVAPALRRGVGARAAQRGSAAIYALLAIAALATRPGT